MLEHYNAVIDSSLAYIPAEKIVTGGELESIASGLALMGHEPDLARWGERAVLG